MFGVAAPLPVVAPVPRLRRGVRGYERHIDGAHLHGPLVARTHERHPDPDAHGIQGAWGSSIATAATTLAAANAPSPTPYRRRLPDVFHAGLVPRAWFSDKC